MAVSSVNSSTSSSTGSTTSSSSTSSSSDSTAPTLTPTQQNLENLLVQYGASESADVQAMVARVASQLGVSYTEVHEAALKDAATKKEAADAAKAEADAQAKAAKDAAYKVKKQHDKVEAAKAAEEYRRHRINNWYVGFASQS